METPLSTKEKIERAVAITAIVASVMGSCVSFFLLTKYFKK